MSCAAGVPSVNAFIEPVAGAVVAGVVTRPRRRGFGLELSVPTGATGAGARRWYLAASKYCAWRVEDACTFIAGYQARYAARCRALSRLEGLRLDELIAIPPGFEATLRFEDDLRLWLFPVASVQVSAWSLKRPDGAVLSVGPGATWRVARPRPEAHGADVAGEGGSVE